MGVSGKRPGRQKGKLEPAPSSRAKTLPLGAPGATPAPRPGELFATSPAAAVFPAGTLLEGKYLVRYVLGQGAMGVVYLADDTLLKRKVAVKVLSVHYQRDENLVAKFRREAVAMAAVHHPNVVQIYTFGVFDGNSYFVMEYIEGETLADVIDRRREAGESTHLDEAVGIIGQVCKGLKAMHDVGIVHRDVKPANIMLGNDFRVAITDFGLVRPVESVKGETMELDGTPMYLAPERIRKTESPPGVGHLCDIYSLGVVLYELVTGSAPFESESIIEVLDAHLKRDPPRASDARPDLPSGLDRVIRKAMAKDPRARYRDCEEFHKALMSARALPGPRVGPGPEQIRTFLVIEPDEGYRQSVCRALSLAYPDSTVLSAADGREGLKRIGELRPHVVVMDQDAPKFNALEICSLLREEPEEERPLLVVTAAKVDKLRKELFWDMGAAAVVTKSKDPSFILEALKLYLRTAGGA